MPVIEMHVTHSNISVHGANYGIQWEQFCISLVRFFLPHNIGSMILVFIWCTVQLHCFRLDDNTKKVYKDTKRCIEAQTGISDKCVGA